MKEIKPFRQFLVEGGHAVPGVSPISQENVGATLDSFYATMLKPLGISAKDYTMLGSAGKKAPGKMSGDIDIAVHIVHDQGKWFDDLIKQAKKLGLDFKDSRGLNTVNFAFPVSNTDGKAAGHKVQIDVWLTDNLKMTAWRQAAPHHTESRFTGAHRGFLLLNLAKQIELKVAGKKQSRLALSSQGLHRLVQDTSTKKNKTLSRKLVTSDPEEISTMLFGHGAGANRFMSFETILDAITSPRYKYKSVVPTVLRDTARALKKEGMDIPDVLKKYI